MHNHAAHHQQTCLQVTPTSFAATFSLDTAGAVYYVIAPSSDTSMYVEPGTVVGFTGVAPDAAPIQAVTHTTQVLTVRGQADTVTVSIPNSTVGTASRHLMQQTQTGQHSNRDALGFSSWDGGTASASESKSPAMLRCVSLDKMHIVHEHITLFACASPCN